MLVLQQIAVLPAGSRIAITDEGKTVLELMKCNSDGSLIFNSVSDSEKYYKMYSIFKCYELRGYTLEGINEVKYCIEVRG